MIESRSTSASSGDDALLLQFQKEYEAAADRPALLNAWCTRQPHLARRLRARAEMAAMLAVARPEAEESAPAQLGEFQIVRRLGVSMGEVFEAWQPSLKRRVAIKTIRRARISPQARDRFLREQQVLAGLHQTHIVPIFAAGEEDGLQYFVMPYIDGAALHHVVDMARTWHSSATVGKTPPLKELAQRAADSRPWPPAPAGPDTALHTPSVADAPTHSQTSLAVAPNRTAAAPLSVEYFRSVAQVMADAADALQHAHDAHILHRDLKPSNLMVDRQGHCWIIDFGLAGLLVGQDAAPVLKVGDGPALESGAAPIPEVGQERSPVPQLAPLTTTGIMGTPPYMAPEQWHGQADQRSDVYGLGVTLYELLTLRRAFDGEDHDAVKRQVLAGLQVPPRRVTPNTPLDLDAICRKAMYKDAVKRYPTPRMFADDLRRWLQGQPTLARPAWWPRRLGLWAKRNKGWAAAITLLAAFLAVGAAALGMIQERNREADRQNLLRQAQGHRLRYRGAGWSKEAWELLRQAARIRVDEPLRSEAASALIGLDVVSVKQFNDEGASALAFHPSGKKVILGAQPVRRNAREPKKPSQPIRIWDAATDQVKDTKIFGVGPVAFTKDEVAVALTRKEQEPVLVLWNLDTEKPLREFTFPAKAKGPKTDAMIAEWVLSAKGAFAAARMAMDDEKSHIIVWNAETGKVVREIEKNKASVLALSADGTLLAAGDRDGQVRVFSLTEQRAPAVLKAGRLPITALAFGVNPRRSPRESPWVLASGNQGGSIALWELAEPAPRHVLQGSEHQVLALEFSPDGAMLVSAGRSQPRLWNVATGQLFLELPSHDFAAAVAFADDGNRLAIANFHSPFFGLAIQVVQLENGRGLQSYHGLSGRIEFVEISKDGSRLAALSQQWEVGVWDTKTGQLLHVFLPRPGRWADNAGLALSEDNTTLALTADEQAFLWDLDTAKEQTFPLPPGMVDRLAYDAGRGKFVSFRVETKDGKDWPLSAKTDFREHPRVGRIRDLTRAGFENVRELVDFNRGVVSAAMARDASAIVVEGFADDQKGVHRTCRVYSLPKPKKLWSDSSSPKWRGGGAVVPMDPEGKALFWVSIMEDGGWVHPRLVHIKTGKTDDWDLPVVCLAPQGIFTLTRDIDPAAGWTRGVSLHRGSQKAPLATFAANLSASHATQFSRQGSRFAWGTIDGTVILCDIAATQAKLAEARLGW